MRKLKIGSELAEKILQKYPDYAKAPPEYLAAVSAFLADLSPQEQALIADPRTGVATRTKFLPTIADMAEILNEKRAAHEQLKPAHTTYHRLEPETGPWDRETDYERKHRVVRELLGRDPDKQPAKSWAFEPKLKPAAAAQPVSDELWKQLADDGWEYFA